MIQKTIADINVQDGRRRVIIEGVKPEIDWGGFTIKRLEGERIAVEADIFMDSHDSLSCLLLCSERGTSYFGPRVPWSRWVITDGVALS